MSDAVGGGSGEGARGCMHVHVCDRGRVTPGGVGAGVVEVGVG